MARPNIGDIPPLPVMAPLTSNISNLKVIVDGDFLGATVTFNVAALTNTTAIFLLRSMTSSVLAAVELESVPVRIGPNTYDDRDASIVGQQVWYWIELQKRDGITVYVGPVTVVVRAGAGAHAVNWVEASSNASTDDSVGVNVVCEVFAGADSSGGIAVFIGNYQGNAANVLIYQDTTETLSFFLKMTGELVTISVAAVNAAGMLSGASAGVTLLLDGDMTKPCRLTGLSALEGNGFTQITFSAGPEPSITLYRLYRGPYGGSFSGAAVVATLEPTDEAQYAIQDGVINGLTSTYQWYVTAVNSVGESDASDAILPSSPWA